MTEEIRVYGTVECRTGERMIEGDAFLYNRRSRLMGKFFEQVAPGFADKAQAIGYRGMISRYAHKDEFVLGNVDNGTLEAENNTRALHYTVQIPEYHDTIYQSIRRGDVASSSFAFTEPVDDWSYEDDVPVRTLLSANILEVGPCPIGAYPDATVGALRSLATFADAPYDDVKERADNNDLAAFFKRSDKTGRSGRDALAATMAARTTSGRSALVATHEAREPQQGYLSGIAAQLVLTELMRPDF